MKQVFLVHAASKYRFRFPRKDIGKHTSESKKKKEKKFYRMAAMKDSPLKTYSF